VGFLFLSAKQTDRRQENKEMAIITSANLANAIVKLVAVDALPALVGNLVMGNLVNTSSVVMRRERLAETGRFDERLVTGEDYEFFLRATRAGPVAFADIADTRCRVGTGDRLSGRAMGLAIAEGYLRVLDETLARDADRITLPADLIRQARSFALGWVGEQHLYAGSRRLARAYLGAALRIRPGRPRIIALLGLAFLPGAIVRRVVSLRRGTTERP